MVRNYEDVTASRRKSLSPEVKAHRQVFEQAYDIAVQNHGTAGASRSHPR